ncbi:MAG: chemotaxis protein CheW, partial [Cyanobacteriota bacterium]
VPASAVQEIFFLPEISPIPEAPEDILGTVNVRGDLIPIMDLNRRFGYPPADYHLTDSIVVLNWQELRLGLLTHQVKEVARLDMEQIAPELPYDHPFSDLKQDRFLDGFIQTEESLTLLLNLDKLLRYVEESELSLDLDLDALAFSEEDAPTEELTPELAEDQRLTPAPKFPVFFPQASEYERKVLQNRAKNLQEKLKLRDYAGLKPISVIALQQEFFGVELSSIQEFIQFDKLTPIPCTPNFVLGNINLRGEVITLMDIRGLFNLAQPALKREGKAIIVRWDEIVVGFLADAIHDILMLDPKNLLDAQTIDTELNKNFLQGVTPYQEKMLAVLDLPAILQSGDLWVDEAV